MHKGCQIEIEEIADIFRIAITKNDSYWKNINIMEKARQPFRLVDSRPSAQAECQGALFMYSGRV